MMISIAGEIGISIAGGTYLALQEKQLSLDGEREEGASSKLGTSRSGSGSSINQRYEIACQRLYNMMSEVAERMKLYLVRELPKVEGRLECRHSFFAN
jgi:hypothetical protein